MEISTIMNCQASNDDVVLIGENYSTELGHPTIKLEYDCETINMDGTQNVEYLEDYLDNEVTETNGKKFEVSMKVQGIFGNFWECIRCDPVFQFPSIADFICHTIKVHNNCFTYKCNVCDVNISDNTSTHFDLHDSISVLITEKMAVSSNQQESEDFPVDVDEYEYLESSESNDESNNELQNFNENVESSSANKCEIDNIIVRRSDSDEDEPVDIFIDSRMFRKLLWDGKEILVEKILDNGQIKFKCGHCDRLFSEIWTCAMHWNRCPRLKQKKVVTNKYSIRAKVICDTCGKEVRKLSRHKLSCVVNIKCCDTTFSTYDCFHKHSTTKHNSELAVCKTCKNVHHVSKKCKHVLTNGKDLLMCHQCGSPFSDSTSLNNHRVKVHGVQCYNKQCYRRFATYDSMLKHAEQEHTPRVKCPRIGCSRRFSGKTQTFHEHVNGCQGNQKQRKLIQLNRVRKRHLFYCKHCNKGLKSEEGLVKHSDRCGNTSESFSCQQCGAPFKTEIAYRAHVEKSKCHFVRRNLNKIIKYVCYRCNEEVHSRAAYYLHYQTWHDGIPPHECHLCDVYKPFSRYSSLVYHMNKHEGKKPYKCEFCSNAYANCSTLSVHRSSMHSAELELIQNT